MKQLLTFLFIFACLFFYSPINAANEPSSKKSTSNFQQILLDQNLFGNAASDTIELQEKFENMRDTLSVGANVNSFHMERFRKLQPLGALLAHTHNKQCIQLLIDNKAQLTAYIGGGAEPKKPKAGSSTQSDILL